MAVAPSARSAMASIFAIVDPLAWSPSFPSSRRT